ncbi:MAG: nitric oxide reductase [Nitrospiria bacterium]
MAKKKGAGRIVLKVALWYCTILGIFAAYTNWLPQIRGDAPEAAEAIDVSAVTPEMLQEMGEKIIFGSHDPLGVLAKGEGPIGKGQCPLCHRFFMEQKADRCPNLIALKTEPQKLLQVSEEQRSHERIKEVRYEESKKRHANGEKDSGIVPHAETGGQYLIESEYCPNCFVVEGFGLKGTNDTVSPMPIINKPPILLVDTEIVAVVSFLQMRDDPSKWTAKEDWEAYWGKDLGAGEEAPVEEEKPAGPPVALGSESPEEIVTKMTCYACHKIPGISVAKTGAIGPLLIEGTNAPNRIKSPEYQAAVKAGKAHATTPREYIIESIMDPGAFIVPGFADDMIKDFKHKFTVSGLDVLVDHLIAQDEAAALADGMDRLPNEKEGPIKKPEAKAKTGEAFAGNKPMFDEGGLSARVSTNRGIENSTFIGLN